MKPNWEEILKDRLQLYGHRNWLVIADSAYPAQSRPAIETIVADKEYVIKKLGLTPESFDAIMSLPAKRHTDYPSILNTYQRLKPIFNAVIRVRRNSIGRLAVKRVT